MSRQGVQEWFSRAARFASTIAGRSEVFALICLIIIVWFATGPLFQWGNGWQLFINTFTTLLTTILVLLVQNSQNRDSQALHLKMDEVIRVLHLARNSMMAVEDLSEADLKTIRATMLSDGAGKDTTNE